MTNKRCLIYETLGSVSNLEVFEGKGDGLMRLHGVFGVCGVKNQNNRVYDKTNYGQMVEALQQKIKESGCPGELEHPNSMNINLENVSHKIEEIKMNEDGTVTGTIVLLNTPKGQIAKAIVEGGLPLFISSRGAGTITNEGRVTLSSIQTYDLVGTPGFSQAKLTLKTNQTLECLNEGLDEGNAVWAIVEGEDSTDDLLSDDDDDKKKEDKSDDKKEEDSSKSDDKKDDDKSDDKSDEEDKKPKDKKPKKENSDKEDNKNNDEDINMKDLKDAIDKLSEKVTTLESELHVAQESLKECKSVEPVNYKAIERWVNQEFSPSFMNQVEECIDDKISEAEMNTKIMIDDKVSESLTNVCEGVQSWITKEFAPEVQNWITEEFAPEVQNWITEEFAPEVQNWICEEFSPEVQNWITEEFAPKVQDWITEEFAPVVEGWVNEEFSPEIQNKVNENVSAFMESQKAGRLDEIDSLLESIESSGNNVDVNNIIKEQQTANKFAGIYCVDNMPAEYAPKWNTLTESRQQEIVRSSKMYDFTKEGVLESFWSSIDFEKVNESKETNVFENDPIYKYQNNIIKHMKSLRGYNV